MQETLSLVHRIQEPVQAYGGPPPIMLLLHGLGGDESSLFFLADKLDDRFFFVSARAPYDSGGGGYAWFHALISPGGSTIEPEEAEKSRRLLLDFIDELGQAYPVDARRVYLM